LKSNFIKNKREGIAFTVVVVIVVAAAKRYKLEIKSSLRLVF